jgi:hypothetical protein
MPPASAKTGVGAWVAMVIENFFNAVDRAFRREATRILSPFGLELKTALVRKGVARQSGVFYHSGVFCQSVVYHGK